MEDSDFIQVAVAQSILEMAQTQIPTGPGTGSALTRNWWVSITVQSPHQYIGVGGAVAQLSVRYGKSYYAQDGLDSTLSLISPTGDIPSQFAYDAFGNIRASGSTGKLDATPIMYKGGEYNPVSKLVFLGSRYYDPSSGRFLTQDT